MKNLIGETIQHYKILEKLGEGGMGVVYKAHDTTLDRIVALKFLSHCLSSDVNVKERFYHEAKAAASLMHRNVAVIHEICEYEGQVFISMEYVEGKTLKQFIKQEGDALCIKKVLDIAIQICDGLSSAHEKGIVHRDIKSDNILLTAKGNVKITDFGLAKIQGATRLTQTGSTVGTAAYMSPEQAQGKEVDHRSDIFSFGVVLYEMLTSHLPFKGEHQAALLYSVMNEQPLPAARYNDKISQELEHIVFKALEKERDERYQHADDILADLRKERKNLEHERPDYVNTSEISKIVPDIKNPKKKKIIRYLIPSIIGIIIIAVLLINIPFKSKTNANSPLEQKVKSIAVLPFVNMSSDPNQEYFSDGISDELINTLSKNHNLRVIARTSSFYFKGKDVNIKTIAQTLNVKNILEGSVRKSGNNLRISADLVNAETEATLWSNTYDGTMNNIFALQDSISGNVAEALKTTLLGKEAAKPERKTDPGVYNNYLLGKHFVQLRGKENFEKAEGYFKKALSIDSSYAPLWVGLSRVHSRQADQAYVPVVKGYTKARREAEKALELNPNLAGAYAQIGHIKASYDWNWAGADEAYKKALQLEPENADAVNGASKLAAILGQFDKAIKLMRRLIEINPLSLAGYYDLGIETRYAGIPDESIRYHKKCLELNPKSPGAHSEIALDYLEKGKPDSALAEIEKEKEPVWQPWTFAIVYYALGRKKEADDKLTELIKGFQYGSSYQIAEVYAYRNEKDKAFEWLDKAYKQRDTGLTQIVGDPLMRNIVKDPRYATFMKKMKLPL